ncbi:MAG TPA: TonB-dependent receptor [Cyclobacteriaceae bacterium]|nr:TonB-dependent receptor [Cyclobacteriaceae bacterium]
MKKILLTSIIGFLVVGISVAQTAVLTGTVKDKSTQELLPGVNIVLENTTPPQGTSTDLNGVFRLNASPGSYNITATFVGYEGQTRFNVVLTTGNVNTINFELEEEQTTLSEIVVEGRVTADAATIETPLSIQRLTTEEIRSNPGGNFDISRVIQALPGVGGATATASFRNDIIVRGGAPNENVYYLDGIETPVINHFSTQGSSGGPQGILNVSFIEDVTLSTSAFDARYDNVLSSVLQFKQKDGNPERLQGNVRLSATEFATTLDGPLGKNTTFLASARRSYLEVLFGLIDLPIRPNYWDFQYKLTHKLNSRTTLSTLGVGAIDRFAFAIPEKSTAENIYVIRSNPLINQDSYTVGASLTHLIDRGFVNLSVSRNVLDNRLDKFEDGTRPDESQRTLKVRSVEAENKIRLDFTRRTESVKYSVGVAGQFVQFRNDVYNIIRKELTDNGGAVIQPALVYEYDTDLDFFKAGFFAQVSKTFESFQISGGLRSDVNSFLSEGLNPLKTLSPRVALSYSVDDQWRINASVGRYYKLPVYATLGYQEGNIFPNKDAAYIGSTHYVGGVEFLPSASLRFTLEGFFKQYDHYPVSVRNGISIANSGVEFGQIGAETIQSDGKGRAYGIELFAQQKLTRNSFFTISYTLFESRFTGADGVYRPAAWDNRNLFSAIYGRKLKNEWEIGLKFRYAGASPYTPFDLEASRLNYLSIGEGILDYSLVNSQRLRPFNQLDLRVDKRWNFRKLTIDVFLDIQNITNSRSTGSLSYTFARNADNTDFATTDGEPVNPNGSNAIPKILKDDDGSILPSIGFIVEF